MFITIISIIIMRYIHIFIIVITIVMVFRIFSSL